MRKWLFCVLLLTFSSAHCLDTETQDLFDAIAAYDIESVSAFFDQSRQLSESEAIAVIADLCNHLENDKGLCLNRDFVFESLRNLYSTEDGTCQVMRTRSVDDTDEPEWCIPGSLVLGAVEVVAGILVCLLPPAKAKEVGAGMMIDGVRRLFNGLEESDEMNRERQNRDRYALAKDHCYAIPSILPSKVKRLPAYSWTSF
jgi:hypothetical protein